MHRPVVDLALCTQCMGCVELAPGVFDINQAGGYIEVAELEAYPQAEVDEAIAICPADCIAWEDEA